MTVCGIAGYIRLDGREAERAVLSGMTYRLRHRGPDGEGFHITGGTGLGHRRLAILDPEAGAQPMPNEDGSVWVTFNGEIYNFQELANELRLAGHLLRTRSDTEVIVHAYEQWGEACVEHFRGMFAFAVWDERRQRLFLARDRVGIKPLYYLTLPGLFAFASELQAFEAIPSFRPTIDLRALDLYLHFQYIPAPFSIFREVRKLPPAHYVTLDWRGGTEGAKRYWKLAIEPENGLSEADWLDRLDAGLRDTIRHHVVSDVPFGAFLSGGIDSSTVVAYMSQVLEQPVHTFSITFDDPEFDEGDFARQVARQLGTRHHEECVRPDTLAVLPALVRHYGEPFADSSALPTYYLSKLAAGHVKMVLSGDGGDENFAGYSTYAALAWHHRGPQGVLPRLRHTVGGLLRGLGLRPSLGSPDDTWYESAAYFGSAQRSHLWRPEYRQFSVETRRWYDEQLEHAPRADLCSRFQHFDLSNYLPHDILCKVDVASMAHGLEVRVPLLDHVFMELMAKMPSQLKLKWSELNGTADGNGSRRSVPLTGKYLLKKNAERFFPTPFVYRKKQGFGVPVGRWMAGVARGEVEDRLLGTGTPLADYFDPHFIRELLTDHLGGTDHGPRLWSLLFLSEWLTQR